MAKIGRRYNSLRSGEMPGRQCRLKRAARHVIEPDGSVKAAPPRVERFMSESISTVPCDGDRVLVDDSKR